MDLQKTGKTIASLRKAQGYTQESLAEKLGITDKAVSKWERGITCPDVSLWNKLSILLDTDIESLIYGHEGESEWKGLLFLEDGIDPATNIYDKPLINYLVSQFLLVGIKEISIIGESPILNIPGIVIHQKENDRVNQQATSNFFVIYGNYFLYGPDLTKHFKRAMSRPDAPTVICSLREKGAFPVIVDEDKKVRRSRKGHYNAEPCVFFPKDVAIEEDLEMIFKKNHVNGELLSRGMAQFHVKSYDEAMEMAEYVRLMEKTTGQKIGCIEEILIRRGLAEARDIIDTADRRTKEYLEYLFM